ncbi:MAG: response regulator [Acidobacteriaceae bacterium]
MMAINSNALVVEDEHSWSEVYQRAIRRAGLDRITVTDTYENAANEIDMMRFAVAIVDIGLRIDDDRNVDGLRVMEKIRAVGDATSIIVVTGRSGRDVVPIIRDSLKSFSAYDTIAKNTFVPAELRNLVAGGLTQYKRGLGEDKKQLYSALRGGADPLIWDDMVLRGSLINGGAGELYRLVEGLLGRFAPLVPGGDGAVRLLNDVACGAFWSRGSGEPIVTCFGAGKHVDAAAEMVAGSSGLLLGRYRVREIVGRYSTASAKGVVYRLADKHRPDFG